MKIDKIQSGKAKQLEARLEACVEDYLANRLGVQAFMRRSDSIREELRKYTGQKRPKRNPKNKKIMSEPAAETETTLESLVESEETPEATPETTSE